MIDELAVSAGKLARSERESAWREMAKQVAHEIKNPLTPMKLSVQHLKRAWEEKSPQLNEIFQRISQTLVQQIDTLSNIATEFSNFAQMPLAKKELVDLNQTLASSIDLFKELPAITIAFSGDNTEKFVVTDKDQLIRMFSNLLKNAIQAIPSGKEGIINVSVSSADSSYLISVTDNGAGIPADQQDRIFTPNFTTKSGGMGLGLSMVKSIVESSGGKIWFKTRAGEGTTFYVSLPIAR
jgi:nitrogen fixation/metabolism regulation signal transduction histidine kinase